MKLTPKTFLCWGSLALPLLSLIGGALVGGLVSCASSSDAKTDSAINSKGPDAKDTGTSAPLTETQKNKLREFEAELELGRNMAGRLLAASEPLQNKKVVDYVNEVGLYVARYSDAPDRRYLFEVLNDESPNAYACPGGYVFVTVGALRLAESESELAGILGHEIAHVGKQHVLKALKGKDFKTASEKEKDKNSASNDGLAKTVGVDSELAARKRPEPPQSEMARVLSQYLMGPGGAGLSIFAAVDAGMNILLKDGLDHKLEFEADQDGLRAAIKAGYEPTALSRYLARMQSKKLQKLATSSPSTHPKPADREAKLVQYLIAEKKTTTLGATGKDRFAKIKSLLGGKNSK